MSILVTGGAGYIGSHTVKALKHENLRPIVLDNFVNGHEYIVRDILKVPYICGNVGDKDLIFELLNGQNELTRLDPITGIIHFAAYTSVRESCDNPLLFYKNNYIQTLNLLDEVIKKNKENNSNISIVFSSTCATYGIPKKIPIDESTKQQPINPYGWSKLYVEQALKDFGRAYGLPSVIFRYFNAAGADNSGIIGEDHNPETHLIPLIIKSILNPLKPLNIYGSDYSTPDGTCIRDYIHVTDLAEAHILGLKKLLNQKKLESTSPHIYNLGNGKGYSILEVIKAAEKISEKKIKTIFGNKRDGDATILIASYEKAKIELGWNPKVSSLEEIVSDAFNWHSKNS